MNVSEPFIRRPVMTVLLSASFVVAGLFAYGDIPIAALPQFETPTISVYANLPGASPENMASSVATPLEKQFATIASVNVITSSSTQGATQITLEFDQDRDIDKAAVDVQAALLRAQRSLPVEMTNPPSYRKVNPADAPILFVSLTSPTMSLSDLNAFAENLISPTLSTLPGVAQVNINGQKRFAVRVRARPDALAARGLTLDDIAAAIRSANANTPVGTLEGPRQSLTIQANRQMTRAAEFAPLIVATLPGGQVVRLQDVADVEDSVESVKTAAWMNGEPAITLSVQRQPDANTVATVDEIKAALPKLLAQMPASVKLSVRNDRSIPIRAAIHDVKVTLGITVALVVLVIFLFLRHPTATIIPALSLPISLLGTIALMKWLGYTLDNVSLLGITLAVGLVVDDAIVMLENISRHVEAGESPMWAAIRGSREMWFTIVSISVSLVAVFIPIFFMPGVIGGLFHEFAVVVSLAILVSAGVSLTLIPMLAARFLHRHGEGDASYRWTAWFERIFRATLGLYTASLDWCLRRRGVVLGVAAGSLAASAALFVAIPKGFFPTEDLGQIITVAEAVEDISFPAMTEVLQRVSKRIGEHPAVEAVTVFASDSNTGRLFLNLKPRGEREPMEKVLEELRREMRGIPGVTVYFTPLQNLRLGGRISKARYQYTLRSVDGQALQDGATRLMALLRADPIYRDVTSDSQLRGLQAQLTIDRDKANALGVQLQDVRSALYSAFGERQVSTIFTSVDAYQVILQASDPDRRDESAFSKIYLRAKGGALVPLTSIASVERRVGPVSINHQGQLQAITISFNVAPGASLGDASARVARYRQQAGLAASVLTGWGGDAAAFQASQTSQVWLIVTALLA
ncbi:MAG: efflux RND transporter permease subunit, partial [Burkholderiales bacterium]|nr:efflux RND transporter permease subunit [Burkholderiales bacterium]